MKFIANSKKCPRLGHTKNKCPSDQKVSYNEFENNCRLDLSVRNSGEDERRFTEETARLEEEEEAGIVGVAGAVGAAGVEV
ncbi:Hypothetical protein FKW44_012640 [Caligus rogercresseyi]|uniref:Uncharacterized protein n=1 Tax=Caligus rogercresseyi TaxID=217165 RepID=A0A7T8HK88_CALRO|nr:Hypothetical protein FKW44_012640 [Caligus rogercresseyi]